MALKERVIGGKKPQRDGSKAENPLLTAPMKTAPEPYAMSVTLTALKSKGTYVL